jgi:hypothetical protein
VTGRSFNDVHGSCHAYGRPTPTDMGMARRLLGARRPCSAMRPFRRHSAPSARVPHRRGVSGPALAVRFSRGPKFPTLP